MLHLWGVFNLYLTYPISKLKIHYSLKVVCCSDTKWMKVYENIVYKLTLCWWNLNILVGKTFVNEYSFNIKWVLLCCVIVIFSKLDWCNIKEAKHIQYTKIAGCINVYVKGWSPSREVMVPTNIYCLCFETKFDPLFFIKIWNNGGMFLYLVRLGSVKFIMAPQC